MCNLWLPIYDFVLVFNSNIWHNSDPLRDTSLKILSALQLGLSRSLKVKAELVLGLPIYGWLLVFNSIVWPKPSKCRLFYDIWDFENLERSNSRSLIQWCSWSPHILCMGSTYALHSRFSFLLPSSFNPPSWTPLLGAGEKYIFCNQPTQDKDIDK